jgi:class 3 adenylate cyclase
MVPARGHRTFICSVVFIDIVEYSKKPVAEQIELKERLNALLAEALKDVAANDRIILDTGDGAAISFVGDPEDALFVCIGLREALAAEGARPDAPPLALRIGINLGPVKLIRDLNGQPNIIGDGINVAQRIMGFAEPNQILVSRSYYEVVSCLSDAYARLFHYQGSRTDKHVREHELYAVGEGTSDIRSRQQAAQHRAPGPAALPAAAKSVVRALAESAARVTEELRGRPRLSTAIAAATILAAAATARGLREAPPEPQQPSVAQASLPAEQPPAQVAPPEPRPVPEPPRAAEKPAPKPAPARPARGVPPPATPPAPALASAEPQAPVSQSATLSFAIAPWGEIYVNGKKRGVSPPLREVQVNPGEHTIEVRNTTFPPLVRTVSVEPGERLRIQHKFH